MSQVTVSKGDTVRVVPAELADRYRDRGYEVSDVVAQATQLKGQALDDALRDNGLPTSGTADEKRQRLAEYLANPTG